MVSVAPPPSQETEALLTQKLKVLSRGSPMVVLTSAVLIVLVFVVNDGDIPNALLFNWMGVYAATLVGRLVVWRAYLWFGALPSSKWLWLFRLSSALNGLVMGAGAAAMHQYADPAFSSFLTIAVFGAAFVAMSLHSADPPTSISYSAFALAPIALSILSDFSLTGVATALMIIAFVSYGLVVQFRSYRLLARNISSRVRAIEDAQALAQVQDELRVARDQAQALASTKSRILANMSHEMRSPLAAILGFSERALNEGSDTSQLRAALNATQLSARHLLDLVNDVLDASRIDAGEINIQISPVDPMVLLDHVNALLSDGAKAKNLKLQSELIWPLPSRIPADGLRLKQVLVNLVSNAIKFSDHGCVTVSLSADRTHHTVEFTIRDSGIGISAQQLQRLFQPFSQGDPSNARRFAGTGLGLYISRQLMERMGGNIAVASELGQGSCFRVRLPLDAEVSWIESQPPRVPVAPRRALPRSKLRGNVLVAEDDELLRELIASMLQEIGVQFDVVNNGLEAIERAKTGQFDLALLDMHMPILDGAGATRGLRHEGFQGPIIALTADVLPESISAHMAAGVTEVLGKPITATQLQKSLGQYLPSELPQALQAQLDEKLLEVRERFYARQPEELAGLQEEYQRQDWVALKARLHRLKGSTGMLRLSAINGVVRQAEAALVATQREQFDAQFNDLCAHLQRQ